MPRRPSTSPPPQPAPAAEVARPLPDWRNLELSLDYRRPR